MKIIVLITALLLVNLSFSQVAEGYIQYNIDVKALDSNISTKQNAALLRDSKMEIYFAEGRNRIDFKMGDLYTTSIRINKSMNMALTLNTSMMGKYASLNHADEIQYNEPDSSATVQLLDETKMILGFECKKAIVITGNNKTTYWYTNEIDAKDIDKSIVTPLVPGFPMEFSSTENGMLMIFKASNYKDTIEDKAETFSTLPPPGYKLSE